MSSKTQPRPILKKGNSKSHKQSPLFFSGNEPSLHEVEDEHSCENRYQVQHDKYIDQLNDFKKLNFKAQFSPPNQVNQSNRKENDNDNDDEDENSRFKKSCLKSNSNPLMAQKAEMLSRKRPLSTVYIFHSKEIDNEIMKILIKSTDSFLDEFKRTVLGDAFDDEDDSKLLSNFRELFLPKLKHFLLNSEPVTAGQVRASNLGVILSEPLFSDVQSFRKKAFQDRLSTSRSEQFSFKYVKDNNDFNLNIKTKNDEEKPTKPPPSSTQTKDSSYGSLPATSFFDSYTNELKLRESVLLKSIRSKSLKPNQDSLLIAHTHAAFNKSPKDANKCIVSAATTTKKIVRFADAFGLDLEKVKIITNNSFMDAFSHEFQEEKAKEDNESVSTNAVSNPFLVLIPLFSLRKIDTTIRLEDYIYDYENKIIKCVVKVKNFAFEKRVFARISFNNWKSHYDLDAIFVRSDNKISKEKTNTTNHLFDLFGFCIVIPEKSSLPLDNINNNNDVQSIKPLDDCILRVEFALCCLQNGISYWDNNFGENYKFQCFYNKNN